MEVVQHVYTCTDTNRLLPLKGALTRNIELNSYRQARTQGFAVLFGMIKNGCAYPWPLKMLTVSHPVRQ